MGCVKSSNKERVTPIQSTRIRKPSPWNYHEEITREELQMIRNQFWEHIHIYGGRQEIWNALRSAAEAEVDVAQAILDRAGIRLHVPDMRVCFDEGGYRYELPLFVLSEPSNLIEG